MKKYIFLLILLFIPISVFSLEYPNTNSKMVEIYDLNDNKVLYEVDSNKQVSIASLTKIATIITAIENIDDMSKEVTMDFKIMSSVDPIASKAGLKLGDKVTYKDLLYAAMLPSGADATNAIAISSSGSIDNFVDKMNKLAKKLKLENTHFVNVTGLDEDNHYSTADDVRKLLEYSLKNDLFKELYTTKEYTLSNGLVVKSTLYKYNTNDELINKILGSKTGHTENAGYCLSTLSNINGHDVITIVLKGDNSNDHLNDTNTLIDFMNNNYKEEVLVEKDKVVKTLPVVLSKIDKYEIKSNKEIKKYLPSDYDKNKIKIEYKGLEELNFRNHKGEKIGTINYFYDKELLDKQDIVLKEEIKIDLIKVLKEYYLVILGIILLIILIIFLLTRKKKKKKKARK